MLFSNFFIFVNYLQKISIVLVKPYEKITLSLIGTKHSALYTLFLKNILFSSCFYHLSEKISLHLYGQNRGFCTPYFWKNFIFFLFLLPDWKISLHIFKQNKTFLTPKSEIFYPFTYINLEGCFVPPFLKIYLTPSLIPTGRAVLYTHFSKKLLPLHLFGLEKTFLAPYFEKFFIYVTYY